MAITRELGRNDMYALSLNSMKMNTSALRINQWDPGEPGDPGRPEEHEKPDNPPTSGEKKVRCNAAFH